MTEEYKKPSAEEILIEDYRPKYREHFRALNYEWLERYFSVEPYDRIVLADPQREVIGRGGCVLFALIGEDVAGTCALIKHTERKFELAKMGVSPKFQGRGVGRRLCRAAIARAAQLGAETLILATSPRLEAANHLYRSLGFMPVDTSEFGPLPYSRHSIVMALDLTEPE